MRALIVVLAAVALGGCIHVDVHKTEDKSVGAVSSEDTYADKQGTSSR
jgi:hypothetical protein